MKNIIFIAPPAAGKGTVSEYLVKTFNYEHISTGEILREEIKSGSSLGKEINDIISSGGLVSDAFMIKLMEEKLTKLDKDKPFILDGFPRTITQAEELDKMFITNNITNNIVIYLDITLDKALERVLGRVICPKCKKSYNLSNEKFKPIKDNLCDNCNVYLEKRVDDTEETFKVRFESFINSTKPILDYYKDKEILKSVDATMNLDDMFKIIVNEAKND